MRIRFAKYFSSVSSDKEGWARYLGDLTELRNQKKKEIDKLEQDWQKLGAKAEASEVTQVMRHLAWAYSEIGYAAPNRSAISNPSAPDESKGPGLTLVSIPPQRRETAQKILDAFAAAGFGQFQQAAALATATALSNLNTNARAVTSSEDSVGLFQLNRNGGFGMGRSVEDLQNPDINIGLVVEQAKKQPVFSAAASLDEAVDAFTRRIDRPANPASEVIRRQQIARQLFRS